MCPHGRRRQTNFARHAPAQPALGLQCALGRLATRDQHHPAAARALRALTQMGLHTGGPDELPAPRARAGDGIRVSNDAEKRLGHPEPCRIRGRAAGCARRGARPGGSFSVARCVDVARAAGPSLPGRRTAVVAVRAFVAGRRRPAGWGRVRGVALASRTRRAVAALVGLVARGARGRAAVVLHQALSDRSGGHKRRSLACRTTSPALCLCWLHVVGPRMPTCTGGALATLRWGKHGCGDRRGSGHAPRFGPRASGGAALGPSGCTAEHLRGLTDDEDSADLLMWAAG